MIDIVTGAISLVSLGVILAWLLSLPEGEDVGDLPALIAGNWWRLRG